MSQAGHQVETASCVEEALLLRDSFYPEILVTDCFLVEEEDGIRLAKIFHSHDSSIRLIFMSGLPEDELSEKIQDLPSAKIFQKPLTFDEIAQHIIAIIT